MDTGAGCCVHVDGVLHDKCLHVMTVVLSCCLASPKSLSLATPLQLTMTLAGFRSASTNEKTTTSSYMVDVSYGLVQGQEMASA
jgi:hypothetical protein